MAEREDRPETKKNTHYNQNRVRHGQNRLYSSLGVKDLREILDRKRNERGSISEGQQPPPDPSYNYLKDPLREKSDEEKRREPEARQNRQPGNKGNRQHFQPRGGYHPRGRGSFKPNYQDRTQDIENPLNIKVEFSTSTGEHTYTLDENKTLPTIKHIPDKPQNRPQSGRVGSGRGWNSRGGRGGRGRGGPPKQYHSRTIRNHSNQNAEFHEVLNEDKSKDECNDENNGDVGDEGTYEDAAEGEEEEEEEVEEKNEKAKDTDDKKVIVVKGDDKKQKGEENEKN